MYHHHPKVKEQVLVFETQDTLRRDWAEYKSRGDEEVASVFERMIVDGDRLSDALIKVLPGEANGGPVQARKNVLKRAFLATLLMMVFLVFGAIMNTELGIALAFLTVAVILSYAYAYDVVTSETLFDRRLLAILILMSGSLSLLATIGLFV